MLSSTEIEVYQVRLAQIIEIIDSIKNNWILCESNLHNMES